MNPTPDKQLFALGSCKWQLVTHLSSWLCSYMDIHYMLVRMTLQQNRSTKSALNFQSETHVLRVLTDCVSTKQGLIIL